MTDTTASRVVPSTSSSSADAGGKVTIGNQANASARGADICNQFFVARAVENDDDKVFDPSVQALRDGMEVVGHRSVEVDGAFTGRPDDNFFHVEIGRVQQAAGLARGEDDDGVRFAGGAEVRAFEGIDRDYDLGILTGFVLCCGADFLSDEEHRRFVAFAFADHYGAVHVDGVHLRAHRLDSHVVGLVAIAETHGVCGGDGGAFDNAQKFQAKRFFHDGS